MARTITSADSVFILSSADFALAATQIQGYAADAALPLTRRTRLRLCSGLMA